MIDAPVSGGPKGAITATMTMVIGGTDDDVAAVEPILADMSAKRVHVGSVGAGHVCKIINNLLCAAHLLTASEAMRIARDAEVDPAGCSKASMPAPAEPVSRWSTCRHGS